MYYLYITYIEIDLRALVKAVNNRTAPKMNEPRIGSTHRKTWRPKRFGSEPGEAADKMRAT